jgi:hypothetical protein
MWCTEEGASSSSVVEGRPPQEADKCRGVAGVGRVETVKPSTHVGAVGGRRVPVEALGATLVALPVVRFTELRNCRIQGSSGVSLAAFEVASPGCWGWPASGVVLSATPAPCTSDVGVSLVPLDGVVSVLALPGTAGAADMEVGSADDREGGGGVGARKAAV